MDHADHPVAADATCARLMGFDVIDRNGLASGFELPFQPLLCLGLVRLLVEIDCGVWKPSTVRACWIAICWLIIRLISFVRV